MSITRRGFFGSLLSGWILALRSRRSGGAVDFQPATLTVSVDGMPSRTFTFTEEQVRSFEENPRNLIAFLSRSGTPCCEPRRRISRCIWACCDQSTRIDTCHPRLQRVLEKLSVDWGRAIELF